jgi:hypothetical protein
MSSDTTTAESARVDAGSAGLSYVSDELPAKFQLRPALEEKRLADEWAAEQNNMRVSLGLPSRGISAVGNRSSAVLNARKCSMKCSGRGARFYMIGLSIEYLLSCSSRSCPPRAAAALAMKAPIKRERKENRASDEAALRAVSAACLTFSAAAFA